MQTQRKAHCADETWRMPKTVLRRRDLRGESKLCAAWLWNQAGGQPGTLTTSRAELAAELGGSERAAGRWLENLVDAGLVKLLDNHRGRITLYLFDPDTAATARIVTPDPQRPLDLETSDEDQRPTHNAGRVECGGKRETRPATEHTPGKRETRPEANTAHGHLRVAETRRKCGETAAEPPRNRRETAVRPDVDVDVDVDIDMEPERFHTTKRSSMSDMFITRDVRRRAAEPPRKRRETAEPIGQALNQVLERVQNGPDPQRQRTQIDTLIAEIRQRVRDPKLRHSPCERAARAVVEGTAFTYAELDRLLRYAETARRPGAAFVASLKRRLHELGVPYPTQTST